MKAAARLLFVAAFAFGVPVAAALPCSAQAPGSSRAGLVVQFDDADVREFCVELEDGATALDLLARTGLAVETGAALGGDNVPVCRVEGVGCASTDCFCRCADVDGPCEFWGYWRMRAGQDWRFLPTGPGATVVAAGEVHGFRWGGGKDTRPRDADAGGVCARGVAVGARAPAPPLDRGGSPAPAWIAAAVLVLLALGLLVRRARFAGGGAP